MKKLLAVASLVAIGAMSAFAGEWSGMLSDSKCKHTDGSDKSAACAQKCVKGGADAVFITSDNKVLTIDKASVDKVMQHLGHKVTITGTVDGTTLKVDSVKM